MDKFISQFSTSREHEGQTLNAIFQWSVFSKLLKG